VSQATSNRNSFEVKLISIIFPCLNEEESLKFCIDEIKETFLHYDIPTEIVVVDNGSTDNSKAIAKNNGAIVIEEVVKGYGSTLKRGFTSANGDILIMLDADGTYDPSKIPEMIDLLREDRADFVIGDRLNGNIEKRAMPWLHRYVGNPFLTVVLNRLYKMNIFDSHCGLRVFKRDLLEPLDLNTSGMEFASEMLIKLSTIADVRIKQIPITYRIRKGGSAHLQSFRDGWRHLSFLLKNIKVRSISRISNST